LEVTEITENDDRKIEEKYCNYRTKNGLNYMDNFGIFCTKNDLIERYSWSCYEIQDIKYYGDSVYNIIKIWKLVNHIQLVFLFILELLPIELVRIIISLIKIEPVKVLINIFNHDYTSDELYYSD
jgi:hypothetical protein